MALCYYIDLSYKGQYAILDEYHTGLSVKHPQFEILRICIHSQKRGICYSASWPAYDRDRQIQKTPLYTRIPQKAVLFKQKRASTAKSSQPTIGWGDVC